VTSNRSFFKTSHPYEAGTPNAILAISLDAELSLRHKGSALPKAIIYRVRVSNRTIWTSGV